MEVYKESEFKKFGIKESFIQDNHSKSKKGVLRGLHYQIHPKAQAKLIRCIKGEIFDVAVDIRKGSPYYGKWIGENLSEENRSILYIPVGFAHGFLVLSDEAEVIYKISSEYSPEHERGIIWNNPTIGIDWPIEKSLIISEKDNKFPSIKEADINFVYENS
jgi:dTDP-4-dehydrorhamnose 3,5-epimerase